MKRTITLAAFALCFAFAGSSFAQSDKKQEPAKKEEKKQDKKENKQTAQPAKKEDKEKGKGSTEKMAITEQGVNQTPAKKPAADKK